MIQAGYYPQSVWTDLDGQQLRQGREVWCVIVEGEDAGYNSTSHANVVTTLYERRSNESVRIELGREDLIPLGNR